MNVSELRTVLASPRLAGLYHLPHGEKHALEDAAAALDFACYALDLGDVRELEPALRAIGRLLEFPDWYGANLDALHDCLTDLSWCAAAGYVLVIRGGDTLRASDPEGFQALCDVLGAAAEAWQDDGVAFWVLFDLAADGLAAFPTHA